MVMYGQFFWLVMIIVLCIVESLTFGLVCIWFAGGAIAALIISSFGMNPIAQYAAFVIISVLLLIFTRPIIMKFLSNRKVATNADRLIGRTGIVIMDIDPKLGRGQVKADNQIWSAKSVDESFIKEGDEVDIVDITGVKLVVIAKRTVDDTKL